MKIQAPFKLRGKGVGIVEPGQAKRPSQEQPKPEQQKSQQEQGPKK